ncbi:MAG: T9SS type A sorting domain-containing protein [Prolixibacteraceae bacterium]|nr:T9SS type A sorting domain-containing protein [Prolixibacteraceae bacterium]
MYRKILLFTVSCFLFIGGWAQTTGYDLSKIVVVEGTPDPTEGIMPKEEDQLTVDSTLDIVNWNVSFLGAPEMNKNKFGNRMEQIGGVAQKLVEVDADVYALQEVVVDATNGNALADLLDTMNTLAGYEKYAGIYSTKYSFSWQGENPDYPAQCLAYIWNGETVSVNNDSTLLEDYASSNDFGYGRLPFLLDANVSIIGKTQRYMFVNIHLKAGGDFSDARSSSMTLLKRLLNVNFHANNVVLLGDFNNADKSGALGEIRDWGFYLDDEEDGLADYVHLAGNKNNGIEHTLVSNELFDEAAYLPDYLRNIAISGTGVILSDHYAYQTRLYVHEETGSSNPENNPLFQSSASFTMNKADYRVIVDFVKNHPDLSKLDTNTYDDSEYYFGASAYYSNFDIRDGKYYAGFTSWEEAVSTGIALALLPEKFPEATIDGTIYEVTFETYSGTSGQETLEFVCTKDAPDPAFAWYKGNSSRQLYSFSEIIVYPNPAKEIIYISSGMPVLSAEVYSLDGKLLMEKKVFEGDNSIDLLPLKNGLYFVKIQSKDVNSTLKILKQ